MIGLSARRRAQLPELSPSAVAVRVVVVPLALLATALVPHLSLGLFVAAALAALATVFLVGTVSAFPVLALEILVWVLSYGTGRPPSAVWTVLFADALYLVHVSAALSAGVPWRARVSPEVIVAWIRRCLPALVGSVVVAIAVTAMGHFDGSIGFEIAGLAGVLLTAAALVILVRARD
jgi:hypothetical protein